MRTITYRQALNEALREEMIRDELVVLLGEDIGVHGGAFGVTRGLLQEFGPARVRNTPVSEAAIAGVAVGAAITGLIPVAEIMYIDFITLAMDQIVNQAAKMRYMFGGKVNVPVVFRTQGGAGRGNAAQHSQSLEAWFTHVPGLKVVMPATPLDAKMLLKAAIRDPDPVVFIEHKVLYNIEGEVPEVGEEPEIPLGVADCKRPGRDVTLISYSRQVLNCLAAAEELSKKGIEAEVIDLRTLVPLDMTTIANSIAKTHRAIVVEEDCRTSGFGAEIVARIMEECFDELDAPVIRVAGVDTPIPYNCKLESLAIPNATQIVRTVLRLLD
jgi:pyruvate/2-oxoglutarate/acetoin dehydrogenase E1 component